MKSWIFATLLFSNFSYAQVYTPIDSTYVLTFDEEFNGTAVDKTKWETNWLGSPGAITKPINSAEIAAYDPAQVSVSGGYLRLAAIQKSVKATDGKTYNYVSGIVQSYKKFEQAFGYIEARVYFPGSNGRIHNFPAFWMNGDHARYGQSWPYAGELDIVEGLGGGVAQYHFHSPTTHDGGGPRTGDFSGWHIYAALWEPGSVTFYYDGVMVGKLSSGITSLPMYLILNNGISNEHGGPQVIPSTMLVDYVHVYSKDSNAKVVTPQASYGGPGDMGSGVVTPPPTPTPTPTPVPTPTATPTPAPTPVVISNSVVNSGFESASTSPWTLKGKAKIQSHSSSTPAYEGNKSAYLGGSGSAVEQVVSGLTPNTTYKLSAYVKRDSSSNVALGVKDFGGSQVAMSASDSNYRKITITFKTGPSSKSARIFFYSNSGTGRADNFEISK